MAVTLLRKDKWDALPLTTTPLKPWTGRPLVGAAGSPLEVWETTFVDIEIAGEHFHTQIVVASALTAEAILGGDFLGENQCSLEMGQRLLRFGNRGITITMDDRSSKPVIVQAQVTLCETVRIPAFSEREVPARIDKPLRDGVWVLEGDRSGRLPVSVANALVDVTSYDVPVRMINTCCEPVDVFKSAKVGTVEEATLPIPVAAVEPGTAGNEDISEQKQKMLRDMMEDCAASEELTPEQRDQFHLLLLANADVFSNDAHPCPTNLVKHRIDTGSSPPIRQPMRRVAPHKREEASRLLKDMLDRKIIQPSGSP